MALAVATRAGGVTAAAGGTDCAAAARMAVAAMTPAIARFTPGITPDLPAARHGAVKPMLDHTRTGERPGRPRNVTR